MKRSITISVFVLSAILANAQTNPAITWWLQNTTGITGRHYVSGNSTPIVDATLANVQSVKYSSISVYVTTQGIPSYVTGPFLDGNPSLATGQNAIFKFPLIPIQNTGTPVNTTGGNIGVFINGVALFDYRDGVSWKNSTSSLCGGPIMPACTGDGVWNRDAIVAERTGFDCSKGHPAMGNYHHHQNPSAFNLDLVVISTVCNLYAADGLYTIDSTHHSPLIGFAYDGFPIYGAYAFKNTNGTGGIVRMKSSYSLRNITTRTTYANGTSVTPGPFVSATYPLGYFREDYQYNTTSSLTPDYLDDHNGRFCITPEYPNGTYCYFATVDAHWNSSYPYVVGPTFYGTKTASKVTSITEAVTTYTQTVTPSVFITTNTTTVCSGTTVVFTALPTNGGTSPSYQWKKNGTNDGVNSTTYSSNSLHTGDVISCILTTASLSTATSNSLTMAVTASVAPSISITASATGICQGNNVIFNATQTNGGTTPAYQWKKNGNNAGTNSSSYSDSALMNNDIISCVLTSNATCASPASATSNAVTMTVNSVVLPSVSISTPSSVICPGTVVTFTAAPTNGGSSPFYRWKKNGTNTGTNASTYIDSTLTNGTIISCEMISNNPCASTSTVTSNSITITIDCPGTIALHLKLFIEGYYLGNGMMQAVLDPQNHPTTCDSVTVELHQSVSPFALLYSVTDILSTTGNGNFLFPASFINSNYYLVVKHKSSLSAWSKNAIPFSSYSVTYDMTVP